MESIGPAYGIFRDAIRLFGGFRNIDEILSYMGTTLCSVFDVKVIQVQKKMKRRKKKDRIKYIKEFFYLTPHKRKKYFLKNLYYYASRFGYSNHGDRLLGSIIMTLLKQKESFLYKKKLYCYKHMWHKLKDN